MIDGHEKKLEHINKLNIENGRVELFIPSTTLKITIISNSTGHKIPTIWAYHYIGFVLNKARKTGNPFFKKCD